jgi:hypothetical protein
MRRALFDYALGGSLREGIFWILDVMNEGSNKDESVLEAVVDEIKGCYKKGDA